MCQIWGLSLPWFLICENEPKDLENWRIAYDEKAGIRSAASYASFCLKATLATIDKMEKNKD